MEDFINKLKERFKKFAVSVIHFAGTLENTEALLNIRNQVIRSASASAAGYRAACRARTGKDFIYKLGKVEEELDESLFWLEMIDEIGPEKKANILPIWKEGDELLSIIVSSLNTKKKNSK